MARKQTRPAPVPARSAPVIALRASGPPEPTRDLGKHGRALWGQMHAEYRIVDPGDLEQLLQACQAVDLVETGKLDARTALSGRNFIVKTLRNLFPDDQQQRRPGRPPERGTW